LKDQVIFHIDVNSAFLSWTAVHKLKLGDEEDIRNIPSVIGGDEESRRGVVLAKSNMAKSFGIITGESLFVARKKCPGLKVFSSSFKIYNYYSEKMMELIQGYSPMFQQYSIDECFLDVTNDLKTTPMELASEIKNAIYETLGFTVNIGISTNKLLAKMASEFDKPNKVNTLYPEEIETKMWPLPVGELFMVGKSANERFNKMYIKTIGDLAHHDVNILTENFKSYGRMIWQYANGIDDSKVSVEASQIKVISNSTTLEKDIIKQGEANIVLLSLAENVATRLRKANKFAGTVSVIIRSSSFKDYSHQKRLSNKTTSTQEIYEISKALFKETWKREPIRLLGIQLSSLSDEGDRQLSLFEDKKKGTIDKTIDSIREKYGDKAIVRSIFIDKKK